MKSLTTLLLATLLSAAAPAGAATLWTTTFTGTVNTAGDASRTMVNTAAGAFTDTLSPSTSTLTRNTATGNYFLTGTGNNFNNYNPNQNADNAATAGWNAVFAYGTGLQTITLSDVVFHVYRYNSSGAVQATDTFVRSVNISADYTLDGGANWSPLAATKSVDLTASNTTTGVDIPLTFTLGSPVTVDFASDDFRVRYTVQNDATNTGAFNGISSIEYNGSVTPVPEPGVNLLGVLGGLLLLRRRSR